MELVRLLKICLNETYSKVRTGKFLSDNYPIQNGLKQGDALPPMLSNFALDCSIRKVQENQVKIKFNGTDEPLIYADDVNLLGDNIKKNTETLTDASKEVGLEINTEKTKYMLLSPHQNAGQNHDITIANRCFVNVVQFRYLGMTVTNQNLTQEEIQKRLNLGNVCYHSVQNFLSSCLLSKKIKIKIYKTIILFCRGVKLCL
jgi:hypothetical protein